VHILDVIVVCAAVVVVVLCALVLARQRFMLHSSGSTPMALRQSRARGSRWLYGVARYAGGELQWFRALGLGTRPSRVWRRADLSVVSSRPPVEAELASLPAAAVIVECRSADGGATFALGESAYTGFVSWLEASAPRG
jgi:hypothetical protein